ncbi:hypothetical protein [Streptomyces sp. NPDC059564]|uniref:hypothetical protein n=1 Tax=Streptomyces sp. NPDC059564 TaxID=3346865 RepID=UPI003675D806
MNLTLLDPVEVDESFDIEIDFNGFLGVSVPEMRSSMSCANTGYCCVTVSPTSCGQTYLNGVSMCPTC